MRTEAASFDDPTAATPSDAPAAAPLIGRTKELRHLLGLLRPDGPTLINVTGTRGVGKSALIRRALARVAPGFADVRRLDLTGETTDTALSLIHRQLSHLPIPLHRGEPGPMCGPSLIHLDRADVLAHAEREVVHLVSGHPGMAVIVESVPRLRDPQCAILLVRPLSTEVAVELLRRSAGSVGVALGTDQASTAHLQRIVAAVDGNPLAIELAAARLPYLPLPALADALESPRSALSVLAASSLERSARTRHATHYCDVARRASLAFDDADEGSAREILGEDYAEALAALRWLIGVDPAQALRLAADLGWEAHRRGGEAGLVEMMEALTATVAGERELAASGMARAVRAEDRRGIARGIALGAPALHAMPEDHVEDRSAPPPLESVAAMFPDQGDVQNQMHALATLAYAAIDRCDPRAAATWTLARQELPGHKDMLNGLTISVMLGVHIARLRRDHATSARLHGSVASHLEPFLGILSPLDMASYRAGLDTLRDALGPQKFAAAVAAGRLLDRRGTLVELVRYLHEVVNDAQPVPREPAAPSRTTAGELTPREEQVLALLARGLRNKEIAADLGITPKSVMHHTVSIYRRLGVRSRTEAVTVAARRGFITLR